MPSGFVLETLRPSGLVALACFRFEGAIDAGARWDFGAGLAFGDDFSAAFTACAPTLNAMRVMAF
jgi:hypothetical protein